MSVSIVIMGYWGRTTSAKVWRDVEVILEAERIFQASLSWTSTFAGSMSLSRARDGEKMTMKQRSACVPNLRCTTEAQTSTTDLFQDAADANCATYRIPRSIPTATGDSRRPYLGVLRARTMGGYYFHGSGTVRTARGGRRAQLSRMRQPLRSDLSIAPSVDGFM
jgi:hypothetical protein